MDDKETSRLLKRGVPPWYYLPKRYIVVFFAFLATFVAYLLRSNMSVAAIPICHDFGWSSSRKGILLSSFFWGYIIPQLPGSWLATRFGCKPALGIGLLMSSLFTIATPYLAHNFPLFLMCRVFTGFFEAVTFPTVQVLLSNWVPPQERGRFLSIIWGGGYVGTITAMLSSPPIIKHLGWRKLLVIDGAVGVVWAILWFIFVASYPHKMWGIHPYEVDYIAGSYGSRKHDAEEDEVKLNAYTVKTLLGSVHVWAIVVAYFCNNWGFYILLTWLPSYLDEHLHFSLSSSGFLSVLPYLALLGVCVIAGRISDVLISLNYCRVAVVRKLFGVFATLFPASFLILVSYTRSADYAVAGMVCAISLSGFSASSWGVNTLDIAPKYAGIITGIANTVGTIPGIIGVSLTGFMLDKWHSWALIFILASIIYCFSAIFWLLFSTTKKLL